MRSKLAVSALVLASLLGATAIASAQTQPAPGASNEDNAAPAATGSKMKSSKMKSSTTTGSAPKAHKGTARNPSGQGTPGTDNSASPNSGEK